MTLEVLQRGKVVSELKLPEGDFSWKIGKLSDCNVILTATDVSKHHARIERVGGVLTIYDTDSSNGLQFNGVKTKEPMVFVPGDLVQLAGVTLLRLRESLKVADSHVPIPSVNLPSESEQQRVEKKIVVARASDKDEGECVDLDVLSAHLGKDFNDFMQLYRMSAYMKDIHKLHTDVISEMQLTDDFLKGKIDGEDDEKKKAKREILLSELETCVDRNLNLAWGKTLSIPSSIPRTVIKRAVMNELVGYGPISIFLECETVTEILVNGPDRIFVEVKGVLQETGVRFFNERHSSKYIITCPRGNPIP